MSTRPRLFDRFTEVGIIVGSILLALLLDAAWADRQRRGDERQLIANLLAEFESNQQLVTASVREHRGFADHGIALLELTADTVAQEAARHLVRRVFLAHQTVNLSDGVLQSYLSSGDVGLISNEPLRHRLSAWEGLVRENAEEEERVTRLVDESLMPLLSRRVPIDRAYDYEGVPSYVGTFPPSDQQIDLIEVLDREGRALIAYRTAMERLILREHETLAVAMREIIRLLGEELRSF